MITPVILCGGSGTRLWPLSRKSYPKQFFPLVGEKTLFQASADRLSGPGYARPLILTCSDFRFIVTEQLAGIGIDPGAILIEPEGRNTAAAVLAAALYLAKPDPEAIMLVAPSDHVIPDKATFRSTVEKGLPAIEAGKLVTFGIQPTSPNTAYGYLELTVVPDGTGAPIDLLRFVEKPDAERAGQMLEASNFLWNAGVFLFKANNLVVVPFEGGWSDLGGWDAVWTESEADAAGVVTSGAATSIDCTNSLLRSDSETLELVGLGLDNIMVVAMNDAVLVADLSRAQDVKFAVAALKAKQAPQATTFPKDDRPWGWFESLVVGGRFQVKPIHVHPGAALSLQSHFHRSEHWITVNYRESYNMYACNGILFNHESPRRGETFVTRKITRGLSNIAMGLEPCLYMGNIDSLRDWGHAKDYLRMQWMMLQQDEPDGFVIATGVQYYVREFISWSARELGFELEFSGRGVDEIATVAAVKGDNAPALKVGDVILRIDPRYFGPAEVDSLLGDPTKAKDLLGWVPEITAQEMCAEMVAEDLKPARRTALLKEHGLELPISVEGF